MYISWLLSRLSWCSGTLPGGCGLPGAQRPAEGGGGGIPLAGVKGGAAPGDMAQAAAAPAPGQRLQTAGEHIAQQHAHRVDIRTLVGLPVAELLGRGGGLGAHQLGVVRLLAPKPPGGAQIDEAAASVLVYYYVLRFYIPVYHRRIAAVEVVQHPAQGQRHPPGRSGAQRAAALHQLIQAHAGQVFPQQIFLTVDGEIGQSPGQLGVVQAAQQLIFPQQGRLAAGGLYLEQRRPGGPVSHQIHAALPLLEAGDGAVLLSYKLRQAERVQHVFPVGFKKVFPVSQVSPPLRTIQAPAEKRAAPPSPPGSDRG